MPIGSFFTASLLTYTGALQCLGSGCRPDMLKLSCPCSRVWLCDLYPLFRVDIRVLYLKKWVHLHHRLQQVAKLCWYDQLALSSFGLRRWRNAGLTSVLEGFQICNQGEGQRQRWLELHLHAFGLNSNA